MGHYDKEYEKYYSKLLNIEISTHKNDNEKNNPIFYDERKFNKRNTNTVLHEFKKSILFGVLGSVIMGSLILLCKNSQSELGKNIYKQMKEIVATNFYYKNAEVAKNNEKENLAVSTFVGKKESERDELVPFDDFVIVKKSKADLLKESKVIISQGKSSDIKEVAGEKGLIVESSNKEVRNVLDGVVSKVEKHKELGVEIVIDHGEGVNTRYLNIKDEKVKVGDKIKENSIIGYSLENEEKSLKGILFQVWTGGAVQDMSNYDNFINN